MASARRAGQGEVIHLFLGLAGESNRRSYLLHVADHAGFGGDERHLHLHRFDDAKALPGAYLVSDRDDHKLRDVGVEISREK